MAGHGHPVGSAGTVKVELSTEAAKDLLLALSQALGMTCQPKKDGGVKK